MSVALIGPGAIGLAAAANLGPSAGAELVVCARRPLERLEVSDADGAARVLEATVLTDPAAVAGPVDWVLLAVKTHQTEATADWLERLCDETTRVLVLQNGVDHRARVQPLAPASVVVPVVVWTAAELLAPGRAQVREAGRFVVPGGDGGAVAELFAGGEIEIEPSLDFVSAAWGKLCANAVASLMALVRRRAEVFADEDIAELALALARECVTVANAAGASLPEETPGRVLAGLQARPAMTTSILTDWLEDKPTEWRARNEVVQATGRRHNVPTPISDVLVPLLAAGSGSGHTEPQP